MKSKRILIGVVAVLAIAAAVLAVVQYNLQRTAEQRVAALVEGLPPGIEVQYGEVDLGFLGRFLIIDDITVRVTDQAPLRIERVHLLEFDRGGEPPAHLHARIIGVEQDLAGLTLEQVELLQQLGYDELRGDYEIDYVYNSADRVLQLRQLSADLRQLGRLALTAELGGVDLEQTALMPQQHLFDARLRNARLNYRDASLLPRVIRQVAQEQGLTEEQVVDEMVAQLDAALADLEGPFAEQLRAELERFLRAPGSLTLSARPEQPVPVMDLLAYAMVRPELLPELLNLSVRAD